MSAAAAPSSGGERSVVLVLGATSEIGRGICAELAEEGYDFILAGRSVDELEREGGNLEVRYGARVRTLRFDAVELDAHAEFVRSVVSRTEGRLVGVVLAFGLLGDEERAHREVAHARRIIEVNFLGAVSVLGLLANHFEEAGHGFIAGLSSVAGDRGRQSNYTYGAAKGALALWLQGLRNRLHGTGVRVVTVKPGFVDTRMTHGLEGPFAHGSPEKVGRKIARAVLREKDVVYVPWFWRYIMLVIRLIPEPIFKRLSL